MSYSPDMRCFSFSILALIAFLHISPIPAADMSNFPDRFNTFGFSLVQRLETPGQRNILISPTSIEIALGMVYAGATGETAEALSRALGIDSSSREAALNELAGLRAT